MEEDAPEELVKVCVLGTGSAGNSTLVEAGGTRVLIDAGFSGRDLEGRLARIGLLPEAIHAIVITHDHGDHTRGAGVFSRRHGTPIYVTRRTLAGCPKVFRGDEPVVPYQAASPFTIGQIRIEPFLTIHDAADPVAVAVVDEETDTIEDVYEPYLLKQGLLKRTPRGRVITERGYEHLGLEAPEGVASLF